MRKVKAPGYRVLVRMKPIATEKEVRSEGGLILGMKKQQDIELEQQGTTEGHVVAIGPMAFKESPEPWCEIGDCVQVYKHSGVLLDLDDDDGYSYRMVQDLDIQAVFPNERVKL